MNRTWVAPLVLLTALLLIFGCGGSGGHGPTTAGSTSGATAGVTAGTTAGTTSGTTSGTDISEANYNALIQGSQTQWATLILNKDVAARHAAMLTYIQKFPIVKSARVTDTGISTVLTDGTLLVVLDGEDRRAAFPSFKPAARVQKLAAATATAKPAFASDDAGAFLPESTQARILTAMGPGFSAPETPIHQLLTKRGYQTLQDRATLANLGQIQGDGVFMFHTHGGIDYDASGNAYWNFWTDDIADYPARIAHSAELHDGELVASIADAGSTNGTPNIQTHFGITAGYIAKHHWSFAKHSMVFLAACDSFASGGTTSMTSLPNPAGVSFGWTQSVDSARSGATATFIFDRMLGTNSYIPLPFKERPFDGSSAATEAYITQYSDGTSVGSGANVGGNGCILNYTGTDPVVLAPSIERMRVTERIQESPIVGKTKLTIDGKFSDQQGTVKIGGVEVPINSWAKNQIEVEPADLPGPGFAGDVQVISKDNVGGNVVPLTQWHGIVTYTIDLLPPQAATAMTQIKADVYVRGDAHFYREFSKQDPVSYKAEPFRVSQGSKTTWTTLGNPPPPLPWASPTSGTLPFGLNGNANSPYGQGFIISGTFSPPLKTGQMSFSYLGANMAYQVGNVSQAVLPLRDPLLTAGASGVNPDDGYPIYADNLPFTLADDMTFKGFTKLGSTPIFQPKIVVTDFTPTYTPQISDGEDKGTGQ